MTVLVGPAPLVAVMLHHHSAGTIETRAIANMAATTAAVSAIDTTSKRRPRHCINSATSATPSQAARRLIREYAANRCQRKRTPVYNALPAACSRRLTDKPNREGHPGLTVFSIRRLPS